MAEFTLPSQCEIVEVLRRHPLVRLREPVARAFVVGSFARGTQNETSDLDVLLEVPWREGYTARELEEHYRRALRQHIMSNDIRGKADHLHPQWCGRRVDVYFTYDAELEDRPKVLLAAPEPKARRRPRP